MPRSQEAVTPATTPFKLHLTVVFRRAKDNDALSKRARRLRRLEHAGVVVDRLSQTAIIELTSGAPLKQNALQTLCKLGTVTSVRIAAQPSGLVDRRDYRDFDRQVLCALHAINTRGVKSARISARMLGDTRDDSVVAGILSIQASGTTSKLVPRLIALIEDVSKFASGCQVQDIALERSAAQTAAPQKATSEEAA